MERHAGNFHAKEKAFLGSGKREREEQGTFFKIFTLFYYLVFIFMALMTDKVCILYLPFFPKSFFLILNNPDFS